MSPAVAALLTKCKRPGCQRASWNGRPGEYCSRGCRDAPSQPGPAPVPAAGHTSQSLCTQLKPADKEFQNVMAQFQSKWDPQRGQVPQCKAFFKILAAGHITSSFFQKCQSIGNGCGKFGNGKLPGNRQRRFHGSYYTCNFSGQPCSNAGKGCPVCGIIRNGFQKSFLGQNTGNLGYYGGGHYSTAMSATAHSYAVSGKNRPQRFTAAVVVCCVAVGRADTIQVTAGSQNQAPLQQGCNSRVINKSTGVDELLVPDDDQMLPLFLLTFS